MTVLKCCASNKGIPMTLVTKREIKQFSNPAQSSRYLITIPAGTPVERVERHPRRTGFAVAPSGFSKLQGSNSFDLAHYFVWINDDEVATKLCATATHDLSARKYSGKLSSEKRRKLLQNVIKGLA